MIKTKLTTITKQGYKFAVSDCDNCGAALTPAFDEMVDDKGLWDWPQVSGGLVLELHGGYGMVIDPSPAVGLYKEHRNFLALCGKCVEDIPFIQKAVKEVNERDW